VFLRLMLCLLGVDKEGCTVPLPYPHVMPSWCGQGRLYSTFTIPSCYAFLVWTGKAVQYVYHTLVLFLLGVDREGCTVPLPYPHVMPSWCGQGRLYSTSTIPSCYAFLVWTGKAVQYLYHTLVLCLLGVDREGCTVPLPYPHVMPSWCGQGRLYSTFTIPSCSPMTQLCQSLQREDNCKIATPVRA